MDHSKESLQNEFEANKSQLRSYLYRMTANREDTEDLLHDTFIKASEKLAGFENRSSLKTWIFTIATNLARDHFRSKKRWSRDAMDLARDESMRYPEIHLARFMDINQGSPQGAFEVSEHINFCFTCVGKTLPIEQQISLLLKEIFDYKISEIACILDVTEAVVKHLLHGARMSMQNIFEKRCSLINKQGVCHQCSELNGLFNPKQNFREQMIKHELDNETATKSNDQLFDMRAKIAKAIDPYESSGADLQFCHFDHVNNIQRARSLP